MSGKKIYIEQQHSPGQSTITEVTHNDGRSFDTFFAAHALAVEQHNQANPSSQRTVYLEDPTPIAPQGGG